MRYARLVPAYVSLVLLTQGVEARDWYASPTGVPDAPGTISSPADLPSLLSGRSIKPSDTIHLLGGTYIGTFDSRLTGTEDKPITVRGVPGQRAILASNLSHGDGGTLNIRGAWTIYRDFEVTNLSPLREHSSEFRPMGLEILAPHTKVINLVIYDVGMGIGAWKEAVDCELYGNIIFNAGTQNTASDKRHGHAIYVHNDAGRKVLRHNVLFNQYGWGIHAYSNVGALRGISIEENAVFESGVLTSPGLRYDNILVMGAGRGAAADDIRIVGNALYQSPEQRNTGTLSDINACFGCGNVLSNGTLTVTGNYFAGGVVGAAFLNWARLTFQGNTIVGTDGLITLSASKEALLGYSWENNHYFGANAPAGTVRFGLDGKTWTTLPAWQAATGLDKNSQFSSGPAPSKTHVWPNQYEAGRGTVVIYNWDLAGEVAVDLSSVLRAGMRFEIRDVRNLFGTAVRSGTFDGRPVPIPMTNSEVTPPVGLDKSPAKATREFGTFVVLPAGALTSSATPDASGLGGRRVRREAASVAAPAPGTYATADGRGKVRIVSANGTTLAVVLSEKGQPVYPLENTGSNSFRFLGSSEGSTLRVSTRPQPAVTIISKSGTEVTLTRQ